jgi:AcrR family transcriptional regulator
VSRAPTRKPAPRLGREQRVDEILRAARDVFCDKGFDATAVAEIAARMGVVEGTIYKYFASKRELLLKVLEHWYEEMFGDYARDLAGVTDPRQRLRLLIWRHLRSIREFPLLCRLMFREVRSEQDYHGSALHARNREYTQLLVDVLQGGIDAGVFREDLPLALLRDLIYGGIEHASWNYVCGRFDLDIDLTAEQLTRLVCEGVLRSGDPLQRETRRLSRIVQRMERNLSLKP